MKNTAWSLARRGILAALAALTLWAQAPAIEGLAQTPELKAIDGVLVSGAYKDQLLMFVLDTGTTTSFIDIRVAKAAGGKLSDVLNVGVIGPGVRQAGVLSRALQIQFPFAGGSIDHDFLRVEDYARASALVGRDIHGILGADFFRRFVVEIDYLGERVLLHPRSFRAPAHAVLVPMRFAIDRTPVVEMRMHLPAGKVVKVRAIVDTGNSGSAITTEEFARRHRLPELLGGVAMPLGEGLGGKFSGHRARVPVLELGEFRLPESIVSLPDRNSGVLSSSRQFDLNVGASVLKRFSVFFDYGRARMALVPNERINDPFDGTMSGLQLATLGSPHDRVMVEGVIPDSPAAQAGFEPGDEIIEVNGERLAPLALVDLFKRLRQPEGTEIKLTARRRNMRGVLTLTLRRMVEP
jgi:hypothetical protein